MKEKLFVSNKHFDGAEQFGDLFFVGNNKQCDGDFIAYLDGYIVDDDFEITKLIEIYKKCGIKGFNKYGGKFNVIVYSKLANVLEWTNDFMACMTLYYYQNDSGLFMISNQFWNMVDVINPGKDDIDFEAISQLSVYGSLLDKNSYVKGLKVVNTASNYRFDVKKNKITYYRYEDFSSYSENSMNLDEATDILHQAVLEAANYIKKKHNGENIGTAISGGLDSRIVPAILGSDIDYFVITGPQKVKKWTVPYNFRSIDNLAKVYGIKIKKICQAATSLETKLFYDIKNGPHHEDNSMKVIDKNQVNFNILITSGAPNLLETDRTMYKSGMKLFDIIEKFQGHRYIKDYNRFTLRGIFDFLFIKRPNSFDIDYNTAIFKDFYPIKIMPKEEFYKRAHKKIEKFTNLKDNPDDALMYYLYDMHNTENSYGAFESFDCQMKYAYSYFHPWVNRKLKNIPLSYINNRVVLKNLIKKYYPQVENISSEHSIVGIYNEKKASFWDILKAILQRKAGGTSSFTAYTPEQKLKALELYSQKSDWYDYIFDSESIKKTIDIQPDIFRLHLKIKLILKAIEEKKWEKYMD